MRFRAADITMAANLDALCDMLDAEISDEEEENGNADRSDSQIDDDVIAELDEVYSDYNIIVTLLGNSKNIIMRNFSHTPSMVYTGHLKL